MDERESENSRSPMEEGATDTLATMASLVRGSVNDPVSQEMLRLGMKTDPMLREQLVERLVQQTGTTLRARKTIQVPFFLKEKELKAVAESFPEYEVMGGTEWHGHALAATYRNIEEEFLLRHVPASQDNNHTYPVIDVGGNFIRHMKRNEMIHSCCPILNARDAQRQSQRLVRLRQTVMNADLKRKYNRHNGKLYCTKRAQDCCETAPLLLSVHSAYDWGNDEIYSIMERKRAFEMRGVMIFDPKILALQSSALDYGINYRIYQQKLDCIVKFARINFFFTNDPSYDYDHGIYTYFFIATHSTIKDTNGTVRYFIEKSLRPNGSLFFRITKNYYPFAASPISTTYCPVPSDYTIIVGYDWDHGMAGICGDKYCITKTKMILPTSILSDVIAMTLSQDTTNFTVQTVLKSLIALSRTIIINGVDVVRRNDVRVQDLSMLATIIYLHVYETRYKQSKVLQELKGRLDSYRRGAGWVARFWNYVRHGHESPDNRVITSYTKTPWMEEDWFWIKWAFLTARSAEVRTMRDADFALFRPYRIMNIQEYCQRVESVGYIEDMEPTTVDISKDVGEQLRIKMDELCPMYKPQMTTLSRCLCDETEFVEHDVAGDGNCLFAAVLSCMEMKDEPSKFRQALLSSVEVNHLPEDTRNRLKCLSEDPLEFGDYSVLELVHVKYELDICVHYKTKTGTTYVTYSNKNNKKSIHLLLQNTHYKALKPVLVMRPPLIADDKIPEVPPEIMQEAQEYVDNHPNKADAERRMFPIELDHLPSNLVANDAVALLELVASSRVSRVRGVFLNVNSNFIDAVAEFAFRDNIISGPNVVPTSPHSFIEPSVTDTNCETYHAALENASLIYFRGNPTWDQMLFYQAHLASDGLFVWSPDGDIDAEILGLLQDCFDQVIGVRPQMVRAMSNRIFITCFSPKTGEKPNKRKSDDVAFFDRARRYWLFQNLKRARFLLMNLSHHINMPRELQLDFVKKLLPLRGGFNPLKMAVDAVAKFFAVKPSLLSISVERMETRGCVRVKYTFDYTTDPISDVKRDNSLELIGDNFSIAEEAISEHHDVSVVTEQPRTATTEPELPPPRLSPVKDPPVLKEEIVTSTFVLNENQLCIHEKEFRPKYVDGSGLACFLQNASIEYIEANRVQTVIILRSHREFREAIRRRGGFSGMNFLTSAITSRHREFVLVEDGKVLWPTSGKCDLDHNVCVVEEKGVLSVRPCSSAQKTYSLDPRTKLCLEPARYVMLRDVPFKMTKIRLIQGCPGGGKTRYIVNHHNPKTDIVLTPTREAALMICRRSRSLEGWEERRYRTIDSYIINPDVKARSLWFDEAFMNHPGLFMLLASVSCAEEIVLVGDALQVGFINRTPTIPLKYTSIIGMIKPQDVLKTSHRIPKDVALALRNDYAEVGVSLGTTNERNNTMKHQLVANFSHVDLSKADVILTFLKADRDEMQLRYKEKDVFTVNQYQGNEAKNVVLVRCSTKTTDKLFSSLPHARVAISRHTHSFIYITKTDFKSSDDAVLKYMRHLSGGGIAFAISPYQMGNVTTQSNVGRGKSDFIELNRKRNTERSICVVDDKGKYNPAPLEEYVKWHKRPVAIYGHDLINCGAPLSEYDRLEKIFGKKIRYYGPIRDADRDERLKFIKNYMKINVIASGVNPETVVDSMDFGVEILSPTRWVCPPKSTASVTDIQWMYLKNFPTHYGCDRTWEDTIIRLSDLSINIDNLVCDLTRRKLPEYAHGFMEPSIRTGISAPRVHDFYEMILAIIKRNKNVPELHGDIDEITTARDMFERWKGIFLKTSEAFPEIQYNEKLAYDWLQELPAAKVKGHKDQELEIAYSRLLEYKAMIKRNVKPKPEAATINEYQSLQTICYQGMVTNALYSPVFKLIKRRFLATLKSKFVINVDMSNDELEEKMSKMNIPKDYEKIEEDMSKYDKSQGLVLLLFELLVYQHFGMNQGMLDMWYQIHELTLLNDKANKIKTYVWFQRKSGDAATFIGNTIVLTGILSTLYPLENFYGGLFAGDDSLLFGDKKYPEKNELCATVFNIETKLMDYKFSMFCSKFICHQSDGSFRVLPDPLKMIMKLGRHDLRNPFHVKEYMISFRDNLQPLREMSCWSLVEMASAERYPVGINIFDIETLLCFVHDDEKFKKLYTYTSHLPMYTGQSALMDL